MILDWGGCPRKATEMSTIESPGRNRPEFSFTELSTAWLLVGVGCTCVALWAVIATTIGV